jgi:hypothetical protein
LDTLRGEESIHNFSSLELIKSEFFIILSDVLCESHERLTYDISDIYVKTLLFKSFQESTKVSSDWNDEPYGNLLFYLRVINFIRLNNQLKMKNILSFLLINKKFFFMFLKILYPICWNHQQNKVFFCSLI